MSFKLYEVLSNDDKKFLGKFESAKECENRITLLTSQSELNVTAHIGYSYWVDVAADEQNHRKFLIEHPVVKFTGDYCPTGGTWIYKELNIIFKAELGEGQKMPPCHGQEVFWTLQD